MQTYRVNLSTAEGSLPAFEVKATSPQAATEKVINILAGLRAIGRLEGGYMMDKQGNHYGIV